MNALGRYLRSRAQELGMTTTELARRSGASRQTLQSIGMLGGRLPQIETLVKIALALRVHPLRLIHLVFEDYQLPMQFERQFKRRGDKSAFVADVTIPDGEPVYTGTRFTKVWEVQNVGTVAWVDRYLQCMDEQIVVTSVSGVQLRITERLRPMVGRIAIPETQPGDVVRMSVDFVAPSLPGTCLSYWKSVFADGRECFPNAVGLSCMVRVVSMQAAGVSNENSSFSAQDQKPTRERQ